MPSSSPPPPSARRPSWVDDERATGLRDESAATLPLVLETGSVLAGKYCLRRTAGFGGMAQLWVATNEATGAEVCVKVLVPDHTEGDAVERFRREAYAAARLNHRAIVKVFDLVELGPTGATMPAGGKPTALAIVMELLHGDTLGDVLMKRDKLPLDEAIDIALPFLSALAHAHRAGVVHRDLKPDNIFLSTDPDGHVIPKVLDFGISKMSQSGGQDALTGRDMKQLTFDGVMLGTPSYMSPEQARGSRDIDARSDVFSAGILIYMMIAGKNPFESESFHSVITAILEREPPRLADIPEAVWAVIERALAKDPKERYADATELGIAFRRATGRTSTTDSGAHLASALPASVRGKAIVTPLGGDSHVTVPPVVDVEEGELDVAAGVPSRDPQAVRQRAIRVVAGIVAASLAIVVVAVFRSSEPSSSVKPPAESSAPSTVSPVSPPSVSTPATATATASVLAAPSNSPDAGGGAIPREAEAPGTAKKPLVPTNQPPSVLPPPVRREPPREPPREPSREPAIVRDPGF